MAYLTTLRPIADGQCIYCQLPSDALTEEHVVPAGLGGTRTLPAASCEECRQLTHAFETTALRHVVGPGRYWLGIPTRKKKRPEYWPAYRRSDVGPDQKVMIPTAELPFFLFLPTFATNEAIRGSIPRNHVPDDVDGGLIITESPVSLKSKLAAYNADYLASKLDHLAFARMLAKIALGYCVIEFGRNNFTPAVTPLILGKTNGYRDLVSSSHTPILESREGSPLEREYKHQLLHKISNKTGMVCVRIDLFENLDAPSYYVMAGTVGGLTLRFGALENSHA